MRVMACECFHFVKLANLPLVITSLVFEGIEVLNVLTKLKSADNSATI